MSSFSIQNVAAADRPYEWGHAAPRAAGQLLWDYWNGPTSAARVAALEAGGRWRVGDGTAALPSLSFVDDSDSGLYRIGADNIGLALNGAKVVDFGASQVDVPGLKVDNVVYPGTTAAGELLYASSTNQLGRLPVGDGLEVSGSKLRVKLNGGSLARAGAGLKLSDSFIHGLTTTNIASADKIPFSDESAAGDPNRAITFANLKAALNIPAAATGFDLHDDVGTAATPSGSDRFLFSDEGESGDPNRYVTFDNLKTALGVPSSAAVGRIPTASPGNSKLWGTNGSGALGWYDIPSGGTTANPFDLHDDISTELTSIASSDRFAISDESESGDPMKYVTATRLRSYVRSGQTIAWGSVTGKPTAVTGLALSFWTGTQTQYDGVTTKDSSTVYFVTAS